MPSLLSQFAPTLSSREGEGLAGDDSSGVVPKLGVNRGGGISAGGVKALLTGMGGASVFALAGGGSVLRTGFGGCAGICAGISGLTGVPFAAVSTG